MTTRLMYPARFSGFTAVAVACLLVSACQTPPTTKAWLTGFERSPAPLPASSAAPAAVAASAERSIAKASGAMIAGPASTTASSTVSTAAPTSQNAPTTDTGPADIVVNFDQISLPAFIQVIYSTILKRAVSIDPVVLARTDVVTFRATKPQTAQDVARLTRQLLKSYGLAVQDFEGLVRIVPDNAATGYLPQIRRGRAQADVPMQLRPVFQLVEMEVVRVPDVVQWLRTVFGTKIQILEDSFRQGLLLSGQPDDIASAIEVIQILDQPVLRGTKSIRLNPLHSTADELARRLTDVMAAQGIAAATNPQVNPPLLVMPIGPLNAVFVFSSSDALIEHVVKWAKELDQPPIKGSTGSVFSYPVKHSDAADLGRVFGELLGATSNSPAAATSAAPVGSGIAGGSGSAASAPRPVVSSFSTASGIRIVANSATNTLLVQGGKAEEYSRWQQLLAELDRPVKSALIEVVVAELAMNENSSLGVEWALQDLLRRSGSAAISTLGGLGVPTRGGLSITLRDNASTVRGLINALASDSRARILSSPKLVARNGEFASIQVGQEVPIITSQQSGGTSGSGAFGGTTALASVLQTVQYRSTGVILRVKPIIHSNNRLDLDVSQEVSSAAETRTGVSSSPTISNRKIETKLSMRDGSTVLLAGLISSSDSESSTGIPFARDVPVLGNLFKSSSRSGVRTELIVLITSYVINDEFEAEAITDAFRNGLGAWARDGLPSTKPRPEFRDLGRAVDGLPNRLVSPPSQPDSNHLLVTPGVESLPIRTHGAGVVVPNVVPGVGVGRPSPAQGLPSGSIPNPNPVKNPSGAVTGSSSELGKAVTDPDLLKELEALRRASK